MKKYFDTVITSTGQPAIGVSVQVNNYPSLTAATIYSDNGVTPKTNPITTDATGYFEFYVADGRYQINISGTGIVTRQINDVVIEDYADMTGPLTITDNSSSPALKITQTGTGNALVVEDSASTDSTPFVIDGNGRLVVGHTVAVNYSQGYTPGFMQYAVNGESAFGRFSNDVYTTIIEQHKSRGASVGSHVVVNSGDVLGRFQWAGSDGTSFIPAASIYTAVDGTPSLNDMPGRLVFSTTAGNSSTPTERLRIDSSGNVLVKSVAGLGYGNGAGGQVTQVTSKSTGVTLNTPTGQITMNNAALAAGASVDFLLTNSAISGTDVLITHAYAAGGKYLVSTTSVGTGSANIRVTNTTAGSLSEALQINFCVIKGAGV